MSFSASVKAGVTLVQMKMTDRKRKKKKKTASHEVDEETSQRGEKWRLPDANRP